MKQNKNLSKQIYGATIISMTLLQSMNTSLSYGDYWNIVKVASDGPLLTIGEGQFFILWECFLHCRVFTIPNLTCLVSLRQYESIPTFSMPPGAQ